MLIDAVVRQTTLLIAQLATSAGIRAPLANLADQVFLELAKEIEQQGVSRKVAADMFGMALRSYRRKVNRLRESVTGLREDALAGCVIDSKVALWLLDEHASPIGSATTLDVGIPGIGGSTCNLAWSGGELLVAWSVVDPSITPRISARTLAGEALGRAER